MVLIQREKAGTAENKSHYLALHFKTFLKVWNRVTSAKLAEQKPSKNSMKAARKLAKE